MKIDLREDPAPDPEFYYRRQFEIYHDSYLIWDRDTWEAVLSSCAVYRIEVDGEYAGDVIWEEKAGGSKYLVDFGLLPKYRGRGIGRAVVDILKGMDGMLTAVTRNETLGFFTKSGFVVKKRLRNYYAVGIPGFYIQWSRTDERRPAPE